MELAELLKCYLFSYPFTRENLYKLVKCYSLLSFELVLHSW